MKRSSKIKTTWNIIRDTT